MCKSSNLVVNAECLVRVLDQLMDGESGVVGLNHGIGHLGRGNDRESGHHSVWEFFADLGDQQGTHTSTGTTAERVSDLETLETITALSLTSNDIENLVNKFSTLGIVTFGPVVSYADLLLCAFCNASICVYLTSTALAEDEVVGTEELTEGTSANCVHGTRLKIDKDCTRDIFVARCLDVLACGCDLELRLITSLK